MTTVTSYLNNTSHYYVAGIIFSALKSITTIDWSAPLIVSGVVMTGHQHLNERSHNRDNTAYLHTMPAVKRQNIL